ncbi:MAG: FAD-dependent tricarballylate dehydrogenase TcuA [Chloroflexi bacterium]|nr:FAD-dependent tricarballylate dehydrogenase TcuA [Chloroflexota bacterium]
MPDYDVIVVGAGAAALVAGVAARNEGARVLVLEKAPKELRSGNCRFAGATCRFWHRGLQEILEFLPDLTEEEAQSMIVPEFTADEWYNKIMEVTEERADPKLTETLVTESNATARWLKDQGVKFEVATNKMFSVREGDKLRWKPQHIVIRGKGGGLGFADAMFDIAGRKGVEVLYQTKVVKLLCDSRGAVRGVTVQDREGFRDIPSKAVILACGGFESNREWRARYLGTGWDLVRPRGTRFNTGDGLRMALEIGAQPAGHWSGCNATAIGYQLSRVPEGEDIGGLDHRSNDYNVGVEVNANGMRFLDEGADYTAFVYSKYGAPILEQPGAIAWQIFDAKVAHLMQEEYRGHGSTAVTANSIEELAEQLGMPALNKTIGEFNAAVREDVPLNYLVKDGRGTVGITPPKSNWARKIDEPPFLAYAVGCGITYTFGGLKINPRAQVLDREGEVIPGLYATGEIVGGVWHKNYTAGGGVMLGEVFGRIGGANAAGE